jgi:glucokinase
MEYLVGMDIGGTNLKAGRVSLDGKIVKKTIVPSLAGRGKEAFINNIKNTIKKVMSDDVAGIGVGCPGPLDPREGVILFTPNLPLANTRLKDILEKEFSVPVKIENDANCFVLGEAVFGKARKFNSVVGFTLGTGLGGGIVINKEIIHGVRSAGHFAFTSINLDGIRGKISTQGAAEDYVSKRGIMRLARGTGAREPHEIYEMAKKGNRKAIMAFEEFGKYLGVVTGNVIASLDPDAVVIGGHISKSKDLFRKAMGEWLDTIPFNNAKIIFSDDIAKSSILGAASLLLQSRRIKEGIKRTKKPWGDFIRYTLNRRSTVKILTLKRDHALSLQSHKNRDELWIALDDGLKAEVDGRVMYPRRGEEIAIPMGSKHRLSSTRDNARMLEISIGEFDEDDIVRYGDKYGRAST